MSDSSFSKGIGLAIAASVFWGSMGVCAQYLLQQCSFTPLDLVSMRLVLAGLILLIMERVVFGRNIISPLKDIRTTVGILVADFHNEFSRLNGVSGRKKSPDCRSFLSATIRVFYFFCQKP